VRSPRIAIVTNKDNHGVVKLAYALQSVYDRLDAVINPKECPL
jgi:hypothetical protein